MAARRYGPATEGSTGPQGTPTAGRAIARAKPTQLAPLLAAALLALLATQGGCFYLERQSESLDLLVVDAATGAPIAAALVERRESGPDDSRDSSLTDPDGRFGQSSRHALGLGGLSGVQWASYRVTCQGYQPASFSCDVDGDYDVRVALAPKGIEAPSTVHMQPKITAGTAATSAASFLLAAATAPVMAPAACIWVPVLLALE